MLPGLLLCQPGSIAKEDYVQVTVGAVGAVPVVLVNDLICLFELLKLTQPAATYLFSNSPLPVTVPV